MMAPPPQTRASPSGSWTAAPPAPPPAGPAPGSIALAAAPNGALEKVTVLQAQGSGILVKGRNDAQRVVPSVTELTKTPPTQGSKAYYEMMGKIEPCTVTTVHTDAAEPYYTVTLSNGSTRTTEAAHVLVPASPPAAAPAASADPFAELTGGGVSANSNGKTALFQPNDRVLYKPPKGSTLPPEKATVLKVHWDAGDPPYYSIQLDSTGAERQTDAQRLEKFVPDYNAGAAAPPPTLDWPQCNSRPWVLVNRASRRRSRVMPSSSRSLYSSNRVIRSRLILSSSRAFPQQPQFEAPSSFSSSQPGFPQQATGLPTAAGFQQQQPGFPQQQPGFQQQPGGAADADATTTTAASRAASRGRAGSEPPVVVRPS